MSKEQEAAKRAFFEQQHEHLFGKKPSKKMKLDNLEKKIAKEVERLAEEAEPERLKAEEEIIEHIQAVLDAAKKESELDQSKPAAVAFVSTKKGVHMALLGEGRDVAVMVASAMDSNEMLRSIFMNANLMSQMKQQEISQQMNQNMADVEDVPQMPKPTTEA